MVALRGQMQLKKTLSNKKEKSCESKILKNVLIIRFI